MSKKMTPWFPPQIKPVRKGVYQAKLGDDGDICYAAWNGKRWSWADLSHRGRMLRSFLGSSQSKFWRGFTEEQT
jgi:hypothetical protein